MSLVQSRVQIGPLTVLPGALLLLAVIDASIGLGTAAWVAGGLVAVATWILVAAGMRREGLTALGQANRVTLIRAVLAAGVSGLVVESWTGSVPRTVVIALASIALTLDLVDGRVARSRGGQVTALGAAFDRETDAWLILVLSVYVVPLVGPWVLLIGLARYLFLLAGLARPWLALPAPPRPWAKVVTAVQDVVLVVVAADVLPRPAAQAITFVALALLAESFAHTIAALRPRRHESVARPAWVRPVMDVVALGVVWVALALPHRPDQLTAAVLLGIPLELLVFLTLAMVLPTVWGRVLAVVSGVLLASVVVVSVLDIGFEAGLDRPFDPLSDPGYLGGGVDLLHASLGGTGTIITMGGLLLALVLGTALCVWAVLRIRRSVRSAPQSWTAVIVGLTLVWTVAGLGGARVGGVAVAGTPAASVVTGQVDQVRAELADRAAFERALAHDRYANTPGRDLLTRLRGKDVLVVFVESYGHVAVDGSWFAPLVDRTLTSATARLGRLGFRARTGWMESSTFGGFSWHAHSTLQSGLWIDSEQRYDQVISSNRFNLVWAFKKAGWRTVAQLPSNTEPWPEGRKFYHYDRVYGFDDMGYAGPRLGWARVPDEFSLANFAGRELAGHHRPLMSEIDLDSSHSPWTALPRMVPWDELGDGTVYNGMHDDANGSLLSTFAASRSQQHNYARSIRYSLRSLVAFVRHAHDKNLVMVVLGDHQPHTGITGVGAPHDVPISLIAHDPRVLDRIDGWGWKSGLRPASDGPVMRMDRFRDRFLAAFGSRTTTPP
jgi:phosphatidylglycerophosphate synthase